jgi:hypothetical protein
MYYIYHIPGVKIGCTKNLEVRIRQQKFTDYVLLEEHADKDTASNREIELQKQYGYKIDRIPYWMSLQRITKAQRISAETKKEWLPKVDWKAREQKIDQKAKWDKVKLSENYINMDRRSISLKSQAKRKKIILQYDLDGNFIKEWDCGARNMHKYGLAGAGDVARKEKGTIHGYQWRYKISEDFPKFIGKFINNIYQKVIQMDMNGNKLNVYNNQSEAAKSVGCSIQAISMCCRGINKTAKQYKWKHYE